MVRGHKQRDIGSGPAPFSMSTRLCDANQRISHSCGFNIGATADPKSLRRRSNGKYKSVPCGVLCTGDIITVLLENRRNQALEEVGDRERTGGAVRGR
jgi:hypothetical protein